MVFGVLNILTGIFVDAAMQAALSIFMLGRYIRSYSICQAIIPTITSYT